MLLTIGALRFFTALRSIQNDKSSWFGIFNSAVQLCYYADAHKAKEILAKFQKKVKSQEDSSDNYTVGGMRKRVWG